MNDEMVETFVARLNTLCSEAAIKAGAYADNDYYICGIYGGIYRGLSDARQLFLDVLSGEEA